MSKRELCLSCCGRGEGLISTQPAEFATCANCGGSGEVSETPKEELKNE